MTVKVRAGKLTPRERACIDAIKWLAVRGGYVRACEVAARATHAGTEMSPQGAGECLGSCRRKGLVRRDVGRGHVWFALTERGWQLATPRTKQVRRAA